MYRNNSNQPQNQNNANRIQLNAENTNNINLLHDDQNNLEANIKHDVKIDSNTQNNCRCCNIFYFFKQQISLLSLL